MKKTRLTVLSLVVLIVCMFAVSVCGEDVKQTTMNIKELLTFDTEKDRHVQLRTFGAGNLQFVTMGTGDVSFYTQNGGGISLGTSQGGDIALTSEDNIEMLSRSNTTIKTTGSASSISLEAAGNGSRIFLDAKRSIIMNAPYVDINGTLSIAGNAIDGTTYKISDKGDISAASVQVASVMSLAPQAKAPSGKLGDLYVGSDKQLYFHNGAGWKVVQIGE
ncbi:hypothetical protein ACFL57_01360 [Candidatus Margulisiibacteriota bacterium]